MAWFEVAFNIIILIAAPSLVIFMGIRAYRSKPTRWTLILLVIWPSIMAVAWAVIMVGSYIYGLITADGGS